MYFPSNYMIYTLVALSLIWIELTVGNINENYIHLLYGYMEAKSGLRDV